MTQSSGGDLQPIFLHGNLTSANSTPNATVSASGSSLLRSKTQPMLPISFASHFLNTEIGGLLALPLIKPFNGLQAPVNLYWMEWNGSLEWYNTALILIYITILAVGFGSAGGAWAGWGWFRWRSIWGMHSPTASPVSPVGATTCQWIGSSISILPSALLKFWAAYPCCLVQRLKKSFRKNQPEAGTISLRDFRPTYVLIVFAFMFVGALPWLAKGFAQPRYISTQDELIAGWNQAAMTARKFKLSFPNPTPSDMEGRMLYPRMYRRGDGLSATNPVARLCREGFSAHRLYPDQRQSSQHHFPTRELLPFPQGEDAIVLACEGGDSLLEARVVDFGNASYQSAPLSQPCP
jgi:hypothetical protein